MTINNTFINNIVLGNEEIFFLNTYGSLYSIDNNDFRINWFINLNNTLDLSPNSLFSGSAAVYNNQKVLLSSSENFYILNSENGSVFYKKNLSSLFKPIINNKYIFIVTKNNFLISMELESGKIIYSYDISQKVANFINSKKKKLEIKNFMMINDSIYLFLKNSHVIQFNVNGEISKIVKLPSNLKSYPIFVKNYLLYLNKKNKLFVIN
jgi:outer membrane protein assembly factor BamB